MILPTEHISDPELTNQGTIRLVHGFYRSVVQRGGDPSQAWWSDWSGYGLPEA
jgi:hypothetical protein